MLPFVGEQTPGGIELRFVLERAHSQGYERGFDDQPRGIAESRTGPTEVAATVVSERGPTLAAELQKVEREQGAVGYWHGYEDAASGRSQRPGSAAPSGDAAQDLVNDVRARGYRAGYDDRVNGASREVATAKAERCVSYSAMARFGKHHQARAEEPGRPTYRDGDEPERLTSDGPERSTSRSRSAPDAADKSRVDHDRAAPTHAGTTGGGQPGLCRGGPTNRAAGRVVNGTRFQVGRAVL